MKSLITFALVLSHGAFAFNLATKKCHELVNAGLTVPEVFAIMASRTLATDKRLPSSRSAASRIHRLDIADSSESGVFASILAEYKLTIADWKAIEAVEHDGAALGSPEFARAISKIRVDGEKLSSDQKSSFKKLNEATDAAREKLKAILSAAEQLSFAENGRLLTEEELINKIQRLTRSPKLGLEYVGVASLGEWRHKVLMERENLRTAIQRRLEAASVKAFSAKSEIPESPAEIIAAIAEEMDTTADEVNSFLGPKGLYRDLNHLIGVTQKKKPAAFKKVIDRRVFSEARKTAMLDAIRKADDIIVFKLAQNQDLKNFEAVRALSVSLGNAPIIVAPAFAQIGYIPKTMEWLFNEPNVHFMVDRGLKINRDTYIVDHGYEDKRQNPFVGMEEIYAPTDKVVEFHPRVRAKNRAQANYDVRPGYFVTSGSMSDPAYWGKFDISMSTDDRAQMEAEMNRSVVVLSRRYRSSAFGDLVGSANGIAPRRVRFTEARYGNPEGLFDLGKIYSDNGIVKVPAIPALVLGDIHLGNTDPLFLKATRETLEALDIITRNPRAGQPNERTFLKGSVNLGAIVLHDLIEGSPNNRHNMDSLLTRAIEDKQGALDLEKHVQAAAAWVKQLTQLLPGTKVVVPVDNHGSDWLTKRLQEANLFYVGRPKEVPLILKLMIDAIEDKAHPYKRIFQYFGIDTDQVLFLSQEETYRVGFDLENPSELMVHGVDIGQHGHAGVNGAKSISLARLLVGFGPNVTGHTHASEEYGTSVKVGAGIRPRQGFHRGPSNSDNSIAIVYSETATQLLRMTRGSFIPSAGTQPAAEFFPGEMYPQILERKMPPGGHTTDQFRSNPPVERNRR